MTTVFFGENFPEDFRMGFAYKQHLGFVILLMYNHLILVA
jgi:hypothetical protein